MQANIPDIITAVAGLGTAAYALVDCNKAFWGGVSNAGFGFVERAVSRAGSKYARPFAQGSILATLKTNWLTRTALGDPKVIAKCPINLGLDADSARHLAQATDVDADSLTVVARKITASEALYKREANSLVRSGRIFSAILNECYQRAKQAFRYLPTVQPAIASLPIPVDTPPEDAALSKDLDEDGW